MKKTKYLLSFFLHVQFCSWNFPWLYKVTSPNSCNFLLRNFKDRFSRYLQYSEHFHTTPPLLLLLRWTAVGRHLPRQATRVVDVQQSYWIMYRYTYVLLLLLVVVVDVGAGSGCSLSLSLKTRWVQWAETSRCRREEKAAGSQKKQGPRHLICVLLVRDRESKARLSSTCPLGPLGGSIWST